MPKSRIIPVSTLSLLLLAACGGQGSAGADNDAAVTDSNALENASPVDPLQPPAPAGNAVEAVPPPDAVSHPDGYLPNAADAPQPSEPAEADPPGSETPATEDEYLRNKQPGR